MKERNLVVNGNPNACYGCDLLRENTKGKGVFCGKENKPIRLVTLCDTGKLLYMPQRGEEMVRTLNRIEMTWRREGD